MSTMRTALTVLAAWVAAAIVAGIVFSRVVTKAKRRGEHQDADNVDDEPAA
jgi:F0F1-type ATP synthase membrane subunit c/vacuolar-type H+-ATPase subunit K